MRYLVFLFVILTACKRMIDPDLIPPPPGPPKYHFPLFDAEEPRITDIIGNRKYVVQSIVDNATGKNIDSLYPGFLKNIYIIPAKRADSMNIITSKGISVKMRGWNLGIDVGDTTNGLKVTGFDFPIYDRLKGKYAMKIFNIHPYTGPEYKIDNTSGAIILTDKYPFDTCTITLLPEQGN